jgi:hypothetical protein
MKVVGRSALFQRITEVGTNLLPVTVRVKAGPPAVAEVGDRLEFVGEGLLIVRGSAFEDTPLVSTVTWAIPARAMSVAGIAARTRAAETKVVGRSLPFHCTIDDPLINPVPLTVRVKAAPPAFREVGLMLVIVAAWAGPKGSRAVRRRSRHPASAGRPDHRDDFARRRERADGCIVFVLTGSRWTG